MVFSGECLSCANWEGLCRLLKLSKLLYVSLKFVLLNTTRKPLLRGTKVYFITLTVFFRPAYWLLRKGRIPSFFFLECFRGHTTCGNSFIIKWQNLCNTTLPRRAQALQHVGSSHMLQQTSARKTSEVWAEPIWHQGQAAAFQGLRLHPIRALSSLCSARYF